MSTSGMLHLGGARTSGQPVRTQNGTCFIKLFIFSLKFAGHHVNLKMLIYQYCNFNWKKIRS